MAKDQRWKAGDIIMCRLGGSTMICKIDSFEGKEFFRTTKSIVNFNEGWVKTQELAGKTSLERIVYIRRQVNPEEFELFCTFYPKL